MKIGDRVRLRPGGASLFVVVDIDEDGWPTIEAVEPAPGRYPFSTPPEDLIPAE